MGFKSSRQLNFLHALNSDKQKGMQSPNMGAPISSSLMSNPMLNSAPVPIKHISQPAAPSFMPPSQHMNNTGVPSLPGLNKMPKFGRMKNSLKGQFKNK